VSAHTRTGVRWNTEAIDRATEVDEALLPKIEKPYQHIQLHVRIDEIAAARMKAQYEHLAQTQRRPVGPLVRSRCETAWLLARLVVAISDKLSRRMKRSTAGTDLFARPCLVDPLQNGARADDHPCLRLVHRHTRRQ
jgi:hypothetical protein